MTIIDALKQDVGIRLSVGGRWLVWSSIQHEWIVYEHVPYGKHSKIAIQTDNEERAVEVLLDD